MLACLDLVVLPDPSNAWGRPPSLCAYVTAPTGYVWAYPDSPSGVRDLLVFRAPTRREAERELRKLVDACVLVPWTLAPFAGPVPEPVYCA